MMQIKVMGVLDIGQAMGKTETTITIDKGANLMDLYNYLVASIGCHFSKLVFDPQGHPKKYIRILVNGRDASLLNDMQTGLKDGDIVTIIPPAGGG